MSNPTIRPGSDEEWEDLMRQLRQQPPATLRPFFYARVQARLTTRLAAQYSWLPSWVRRPAYVALLLAVVLIVHGDGTTLRPTVVASQFSGQPHSQRPL